VNGDRRGTEVVHSFARCHRRVYLEVVDLGQAETLVGRSAMLLDSIEAHDD
jgi:hypothetical protein